MKPTLFISHSSADKEYLRLLKELLVQKMGGTIEIFLSSDGQSIPFGNNWVHSVESALNRASVMFVAISPESLFSTWVPFEAGYAYSRKIQVVPIAILGVRLENIPPPLGLLQGFNVSSNEGLNNIIAVINRQYDFTFSEDFKIEEYARLQATAKGHLPDSPVIHLIDYCTTRLPASMGKESERYTLSAQVFKAVETLLEQKSMPFVRHSDTAITARGIQISQTKTKRGGESINIKADPFSLADAVQIIRELFINVYEPTPPNYWLNVYFASHVSVVTEGFKVSSRILSTDVAFSNKVVGAFEYENVLFELKEDKTISTSPRNVRSYPCLRIIGCTDDKKHLPVLDLVEVLVERGVLEERGSYQ